MNTKLRRSSKLAHNGWKMLNDLIGKRLFILHQTNHCSTVIEDTVPDEFSQKILSLREQISLDFAVETKRASLKNEWFTLPIAFVGFEHIMLSKARVFHVVIHHFLCSTV
jgi:hypothetical protein